MSKVKLQGGPISTASVHSKSVNIAHYTVSGFLHPLVLQRLECFSRQHPNRGTNKLTWTSTHFRSDSNRRPRKLIDIV